MKWHKKRKELELKRGGMSVDGVEYLQNIPEIQKKLRGTNLLTGRIWPVEKEEKEQWAATSYQYLLATSRLIGSAVEGMDAFVIGGPAPERVFSSCIQSKGGRQVVVGDTASGKIEMHGEPAAPLSDEQKREFIETASNLKIVPLMDSTLVYNACSTTRLGGMRRLILSSEDIPYVDKAFWKRLILVGVGTIGDIEEAAGREFGMSVGGITMRLRKMSEKLAPRLGREPEGMVQSLLSCASIHGGTGSSVRWFLERCASEEDQFFVATVAYNLHAMEGVDPLFVLDCVAKSIAENPRFRHEYRAAGKERFESGGLTQLMYEAMVIAGKKLEEHMQAADAPFGVAQSGARTAQFLLEMQEAVRRRDEFTDMVMNGRML